MIEELKKTTNYVGVSIDRSCSNRPWRARIRTKDKKVIHVGRYKTEQEAIEAHKACLEKLENQTLIRE